MTTHSPLLLVFIRPEFLYVCDKVDSYTEIEPFTARLKSLWPKLDLEEALKDPDKMSIPKRILRGDLNV